MKTRIYSKVNMMLLLIVASVLFQECQAVKTANTKKLKVSVFYRERIMLPTGAKLTVTLADIAKMDVAAEVIATKTIPAEGGPPFDVLLDYDPSRLNDKGKYTVRASIKKGEELLFTSTEHIEAFENPEDKPVEIMVRSLARKSAHLTQGNVSLENTYWKLVKLNEKPVQTGPDEKELFIQLLEEESRINGYSGCNNFSGGYELEKDKIKFGMLMSTKKMCMGAMDQEQKFLKALSETVRYAIEGEKLYLYNREDKVVAVFKLS